MDGVTILNTYQTFTFLEALLLACGIAGTGVCIGIAIASFDDSVAISGLFAGLAVVIIISCFHIKRTDTQHDVFLDNSVSWLEFAEHYETVKVRGRIITVRERERVTDDATD